MGRGLVSADMLVLVMVVLLSVCRISDAAADCTSGQCRSKVNEKCSSVTDCETGLSCSSTCSISSSVCVRGTATDPFTLLNSSVPFNRYAYLTTHNSFAIDGEPSHTGVSRITFTSQDDNITHQLHNGVRALMLDTYDYKGEVWLCHSFGGKCYDYTAFEPAIDTLKEIESFLSANPSEIVTLILEDYVKSPRGLTKVFDSAGLMKYWFPVSHMPTNGKDWPLVSQMLQDNHRLVVFTSVKSKQQSEGIAYQWNFMVENQYGNGGMKSGQCPNRGESSPMNDTSKSLVLVNHFRTIPVKSLTCEDNSASSLISSIQTCRHLSANRWANFIAVNYYQRSDDGGGVFQALDLLNGELLCGKNDIHACT